MLHSNPRMTPVAGIEDFKGEVVHPAFWKDDTTAKGKRVALVGYGCLYKYLFADVFY